MSDFGWGGVSDLASKIGKSLSYITKDIKLLLPQDVLDLLMNHRLDQSVAEELLSIKANKQSILGNLIADNLRMTRKLLKDDDTEDFNSLYENDYIDHIKIVKGLSINQ